MNWLIYSACGLYVCYCVSFCASLAATAIREEWCGLSVCVKRVWRRGYTRLVGEEEAEEEGAAAEQEEAVTIYIDGDSASGEEREELLAPLLRHRGSSHSSGRILTVFAERTQNVPLSDPPIMTKDTRLFGDNQYEGTGQPVEF